MKIAVTGGAGFIGTVLIKNLLEQGHEAFWLDIRDSEIHPDQGQNVDVTHQEALTGALKGTDAVYHLAAEHADDVEPVQKYYDVNVGGARCLVEACEKNGIHTIIFTSTVAVYGLDAGESKEDSPPAPFNDYGKSKLEAEKIFEDWARGDTERKLVTVRPVVIFGPRNRGNIFNLMRQIASGKFLMIGDGQNKKSIGYVGNIAAFLVFCLEQKKGAHIYNYADKPDMSMNVMVGAIRKAMGLDGLGIRLPYPLGLSGGAAFDALAKMTGRKFPISLIRVKKFCANTVVSAQRLEETGFQRPFTLEHGLKDMVETEFPPGAKKKTLNDPDHQSTNRKAA
jgi:nucleoside-diphosphate-sugar epimerase